jgi:uncharacterized membrane protein (DUF2068 family)
MIKDPGIRFIAYLKLLKCALLVFSGFGLLHLLHVETNDTILRWLDNLPVDPGNRLIQSLLLKVSFIEGRQLKELSLGSFLLAGLSLFEALALLMQKPWAKYFTLIVMTSFIPLEVWKLIEGFGPIKVTLMGLNVAIVWYLAIRIKNESPR